MSRRNDTDDEFGTTESRRRRRLKNHPEDDAGLEHPKPRRRRWPWLMLMLAAVILFLPNMIGWFGLPQKAIDYVLSDFKGTISVGQVSLGWLRPIKLANIVAVDANGNTLFEAESITSTKPLYSFVASNDLGQFNVEQPIAYIQLRPDGSNLEDALSKYIGPATDPNAVPAPNADAAMLPQFIVNITEGQAIVSTSTSNQTWQIDGLNAIAQINTDVAALVVDAQCRVTPLVRDNNGQTVLQNSGGLAFTSHVDAGQKVLSFNSAELVLEAENLPLSLAAPVLQRFIGPVKTAGTMNGKFQAAYNGKDRTVAMEVQHLSLHGLGIVAPDLIGSDQLLIDNVSAQGVLQVSPTLIAAQQFRVHSDVGKVHADGSFDISKLSNLASGRLLETPFEMDGVVDLAKLVRMLPTTLQLHKDLTINSGTVTFQAGCRNEAGIKRMVVNLDTANINARRGSQNIDWAKPLRLVGTIQESDGELALEDVRCISDFLTIVGSADMRTGSFVVKGDLDKLMQHVGQFVDLKGTKLAGVLDGKFGWQVDVSGRQANPTSAVQDCPIQIGGNFDVLNPIIEMPGMPQWQQQKMSVKLTAAGKSHSGNRLQLDQGGIQVDIGNEQLVVRLSQPVADAFTNEVWNADCQLTGSMAGWMGHLQNFVDLGQVAAGGRLELTCGATINTRTIQFSNVQYTIEQLALDGYGMKIREQKVTGDGTATYDLATGNVTIPETTISGSSLYAQGQQLQITFPGNMRIAGNVTFKADANRVADWFELSPTTDSIFWYGGIDGTIQLASNENGIGGRINSTITDLIAAKQVVVFNQTHPSQPGQAIQASQPQRQWMEVWREPKVEISGDLSLANDFDAIEFQNMTIDSSSLQAKANGTIADLSGAMFADISGTWGPSWEKINSLLQAYTGGALKFAGQSEEQFVLRGPIFETATQLGQPTPWVSPSLQAATRFGWARGEILGLPVGESKMELNLDQGVAVLKTNGIPFAGGVVQIAPRIDMRGKVPLLTMEQTRIIDNVALKPETARQWLKYVAPLVADATSAEGNFTVDIGSAVVPVFDPMKMRIQGEVRLANVVIGAGPMAEQLLGTVKQLRSILKPQASDRDYNTWLQMSEQTVPIEVRDGRVFHENVRLAHRDLVIQTRGSVGFDQTLNLIAEIPIADDWIAGKSYLAGLRGKSISVPIGGTISKPVLDKRLIQQLSQDLLKQAAGNLLNNKINEERDKLFAKFGEKLGLPNGATQGQPGQSTGNPATQPSLQQQLQDRAQDELIKGIGNLFGK